MTKEALVISETILRLLREKKKGLLNLLIQRLVEEKKLNLMKEAVEYLTEKKSDLKGIKSGKIYLALEGDLVKIKKFLEDKFNSKVEIKERKIEKSLILGGLFLTKNFVLDFSLRKVLKRIFEKWKT
jgi:F0F1-type ATP synthase delta subunit